MAGGRPAGTHKQIDLGNGRFLVSKNRFAELCNVDPKSIQQAIDRDDLKFTIRSGGKWMRWPEDKDLYFATARLYTQGRVPNNPDREELNLSEAIQTSPDGTTGQQEILPSGSRANATQKKLEIQARTLMLEYRLKANEAIEFKDLVPVLQKAATATKNSLLAIPARVKGILALETDADECGRVVLVEIIAALTNLDLMDVIGKD